MHKLLFTWVNRSWFRIEKEKGYKNVIARGGNLDIRLD